MVSVCPPMSPPPQDAIVVFTGDQGRISSALDLLEGAYAPRLLISGVDKQVSLSTIKAVNPVSFDLFDCCIELDYHSSNTRENVLESSKWLDSKDLDSLILVTSDYHMPRSLLEFTSFRPDLSIHPVCIESEDYTFRWGEFGKYLITILRTSFT